MTLKRLHLDRNNFKTLERFYANSGGEEQCSALFNLFETSLARVPLEHKGENTTNRNQLGSAIFEGIVNSLEFLN